MVTSTDTFDPAKKYEQVLFREDRDLLESELNELQDIINHANKQIFDNIIIQGAIAAGLEPTVDGSVVTFTDGKVYCKGRLVNVPAATLNYDPEKNSGIDPIWLELLCMVVGVAQDNTLVNPITGEATAEREQWLAFLQTHDTADDPMPAQALSRTTVAVFNFDRSDNTVVPVVSGMLSAQDVIDWRQHLVAVGDAHSPATTEQAGFMNATDKVKLNGIETGATVGRRTATLIIAAHDAMPSSKQMADVVCSGTDDQTAINAVLGSLSAGGRVLLSEGTFTLSGSIVLPSYTVLEGQGEATLIKLKNQASTGFALITNQHAASGKDYGITISNLRIDGNRANQSPNGWKEAVILKNAFRSEVTNIFVTGAYGEGITFENGGFNRIDSCHAEHCFSTGITIKLSYFSAVSNCCAYRNGEYGIRNNSSSGGKVVNNIVAGNHYEGIYATGVDLEVTGNRAFLNAQIGSNSYGNIKVTGRGLVAFNIVRSDFTETGGVNQGWTDLVDAYEGVSAGTTLMSAKGLIVAGGAFCIANDVWSAGVNSDLELTSDEWNPTVQLNNRTNSTAITPSGSWT